jgi:hypothetical protein
MLSITDAIRQREARRSLHGRPVPSPAARRRERGRARRSHAAASGIASQSGAPCRCPLDRISVTDRPPQAARRRCHSHRKRGAAARRSRLAVSRCQPSTTRPTRSCSAATANGMIPAQGASRPLPALRARSGAAIKPHRRTARESRPGSEPRPAEGDRPLRARARHAVHELRDADDPGRAQTLLPRQRLVATRPPRAEGARPGREAGG